MFERILGNLTQIIDGYASSTSLSEPNRLLITYPHKIINIIFGMAGKYNVLATDYESYSLVYACLDYSIFKIEHAWILGRRRDLEKSVVDDLKSLLFSLNFDLSKFKKSKTICQNF